MNQITIMGHLGQSPKDDVVNDKTIAKFSVATNRRVKDKQGEMQQATTWFNVVAWGKTAEIIVKHFKKGDPILLTGRLDIKRYQNQAGEDQTWVEISLERFYFVGGGDRDKKEKQQGNDVKVTGNNNRVAGRDVKANENFKGEDIPF